MARNPLSLAVLAAAVLLCGTAPAIAGSNSGAKDPEPIIRFDAALGQRKFVRDDKKHLSAGKPVTLRVINPNTFRERYQLEVKSIDFHNTALPEKLAAIVNKVAPNEGINALTDNNAQKPVGKLPTTDLKNAFDAVINAVFEFGDFLRKGDSVLEQGDLDEHLAQVARRTSLTNVGIRKAMLPPVRDYFRTMGMADLEAKFKVEPDGSDQTMSASGSGKPPAQPQDENGLTDFGFCQLEAFRQGAVAIPNPAKSSLKTLATEHAKVTAAYAAWQRAVLKWTADTDPNDMARMPVTTAEGVVTQYVNAATTAKELREGALKAVSEDLERASRILLAALDLEKAPRFIDKQVDAIGGDEAQFKVTIVPDPLIKVDTLITSAGGGGAGATISAANGNGDGKEPKSAKSETPAEPEGDVHQRSLPVYGRFVVDFGAGIASTSLKQQNYVVKGGKVARGAADRYDLAPALFAHLYYTLPFKLSAGPVIGITAQDPVRYLVGGGLTYGRRIRASLMAGWAFGKVERLNGEKVGDPPIGTSGVSVKSVMDRGSFVGGMILFSF